MKIDGGWAIWSEWGECECDGYVGEKLRVRECDNPPMECFGRFVVLYTSHLEYVLGTIAFRLPICISRLPHPF